jgi:hypothetical protein
VGLHTYKATYLISQSPKFIYSIPKENFFVSSQ